MPPVTGHLEWLVKWLALALLLVCGAREVAAASSDANPVRPIVFRHVTLIDGHGGAPVPDVDVTVETLEGEGWITSVVPSSVNPGRAALARSTVIDGRGKFLIPGLMDVHIHLRGDRLAALAGYLYGGITTVADMGNTPGLILPLRFAERTGHLLSPRIFATGNLITAPHGKSTDMGLAVDDVAKDRALLERYVETQHPDYVKLVYDEGGWPDTAPVTLLPLPALRDVVAFAHERGLRAIVHTVNEKRSREAIAAGVDALAHTVIEETVSDDFAALMAAQKIPFATTLTIGDNYGRLIDHPEFLDRPDYAAALDAEERHRLRTEVRDSYLGRLHGLAEFRMRSVPLCLENVRKIIAAGGIAALGTDQSNGPAAHREMELLVQAGLTPAQVITAATYNAAVFLGKADELGSVEAGKRADLVLLDADPTLDIENTNAIALVMKDGKIVDEAQLPLAGGPQKTRYKGEFPR